MNTDLPIFETICLDTVEKNLDQMLSQNREAIEQLLRQAEFTWQNLIAPLESIEDRLHHFWGPISHLHMVCDSEKLRAIYDACLPKLTAYGTWLSQNIKLYQAIESMLHPSSYAQLNSTQQHILKNLHRDFILSGVALPADQKKRFAELEQQLAKLSTQFDENVLDATQHWDFLIKDQKLLSGLPSHTIESLKQKATAKNYEGYLITLDAPIYTAILSYADDAELRKITYEAYVTRASDQGPNAYKYDNSEVMQQLLKTRHELANLVDFNCYADYSLETKMAKNKTEVINFIHDLAKRAKPFAEKELEVLSKFAKEKYAINALEAWDIAYYSEKLRKNLYQLSQEELRAYFPEDRVIHGLFLLAEKLFSVKILPKKAPSVWHPDVKFFEIYDQKNNLRGRLYMDLYARNHKQGGAWMNDCIGRRVHEDDSVQLPAAYIICNFSAPIPSQPSLLKHDEVLTLFHEFGHALHHLLTRVDYLNASGCNDVEWDAIELPSQFMENFAWEREVINMISKDLPEKLFQNLLASKHFQTGLAIMRQLEFALFDLLIHSDPHPNIQEILNRVRKEMRVIPTPEFNRFAHSFHHIFGGGYAAGYYSYKWAEVLSCDAYALFEETGVLNPETGKLFLENILEKGGSRDAMDSFVAFRGRKPSIDALLRHSGLI